MTQCHISDNVNTPIVYSIKVPLISTEGREQPAYLLGITKPTCPLGNLRGFFSIVWPFGLSIYNCLSHLGLMAQSAGHSEVMQKPSLMQQASSAPQPSCFHAKQNTVGPELMQPLQPHSPATRKKPERTYSSSFFSASSAVRSSSTL